jgi:WD40 repeat protein
MKLAKLGLSTFASSADDGTVRVWDLRDRFPVLSVTSNGVSIVNIAGSDDVLVSALHNKTVNVFDLRNAGKPVLAVVTQDYEAANLQYNRAEDLLAMFGIVEKESSKDSMMFVDNEGESRQRIFRLYEGFVGGT